MRVSKLMLLLPLLLMCIPAPGADECASCIPVSTIHNAQLYNPCGKVGSGTYCNDVIMKLTQHTIIWPDRSMPQVYYLQANGRSTCAATCNKDWIGAPWLHKACWPEFYSPVKSSRYYYASAADMTTDVIMAWCYNLSYVWAVFCKGPVGPLRYFTVDHLCTDCRSNDQDQDGHTSIESGGDDCVDVAPFIYPGAPPLCLPGYDANCDGILDLTDPPCTGTTPILFDLGKDGLALTSKAGGVSFDIDGDGIRDELSWTEADGDDAWLSLDRNENGIIDNGTELFSSYAPQPAQANEEGPNGFLALSVFDTAESGGNRDGVIDSGDAVYEKLLLWRDSNHNGISEPGELSSLQFSGVTAINLDYKLSRNMDEYGNQFRYRAKLKMDKQEKNMDRWAWDVILLR